MSVEDITINCTPGTFRKAQQDPQFLSVLVERAEAESGQSMGSIAEQNQDEVINSIIECENIEDEDIPNMGEKSFWVDAAVKMLLSLVAELRPKVGKSVSIKNKAKMWKKIETELNSKGYSFTAQQIENKYRGLERTFKKSKSHNKKTGRNRESCPYEKELSAILNERPSVFPNCLLGTARDEVMTKKDLIRAAEGSSSNLYIETEASGSPINITDNDLSNLSSGTTPSASKKRSKQDDILEELKLLREERQQQHDNIMKELREGNKQKKALMKERNDILRIVAESLKKC